MVKNNRKAIEVDKKSETGRNVLFIDKKTHKKMTRPQFVRGIEREKYPSYHIRKINGIKTPVSNPDGRRSNNLG